MSCTEVRSSSPSLETAAVQGLAATSGTPGIPLLFSLTLFLGASLLFCVQPMIARMILPLLGGSPSVWNTCMVFFQAALLAGYAYAHAIAARCGVRRQTVVHAALLLLPLLTLPIVVREETIGSLLTLGNPTLWLLGLLTATVGLPFFVVATTAPLLQTWFARTGHPSGRDPYFLYASSNLGSMLALLGYPLVIEPNFRVAEQSRLWGIGYVFLVFLTAFCALAVWRSPASASGRSSESLAEEQTDRPSLGRRLIWVALAFVPSSLLIGVTTYLSTDVAAIPLLWVIPLALYLLTFILVFAKRAIVPQAWVVRTFPIALVTLLMVIGLRASQIFWIPLHLLVFFVASMLCHGELARRRPSTRFLTEFYLAISLGGVLGGLFNALLAPALFDRTVEYPLALVLSTLALPATTRDRSGPGRRVLDFALPAALGLVVGGLIWSFHLTPWKNDSPWLKLLYGLAALACFSFSGRPIRFGLGAAALLSTALVYDEGTILHRGRNFFGILKVQQFEPGPFHQLVHGSTLHGLQNFAPSHRREALTYYHRTGPIGQVFEVFRHRNEERSSVGVVGLGTGTLAAYARPVERWTFFEIDPDVIRVARDPRYFTFLSDSLAGALDIRLGDARLRLREVADQSYKLLILDAFSSDAIPMHLLTREALQLYRSKTSRDGLLAFHISNRYVDLAPALGALARDAGLVCRYRIDSDLTHEEILAGKITSTWLVMAARESDLSTLATDPRWKSPALGPREPIWTDDFSNLVHYLKFR